MPLIKSAEGSGKVLVADNIEVVFGEDSIAEVVDDSAIAGLLLVPNIYSIYVKPEGENAESPASDSTDGDKGVGTPVPDTASAKAKRNAN